MQDTRDKNSIPWLGRSLEEEMATLSSILAWNIPWTGGPCGLQPTGRQRVRHDLVIKQLLANRVLGEQGQLLQHLTSHTGACVFKHQEKSYKSRKKYLD